MSSLSSTPRDAPLRLLYACTALLIVVLLATNAGVILHLRASELLDRHCHIDAGGLPLSKNMLVRLAEKVISGKRQGVHAKENYASRSPQ